ncbi:MAG: M14 family zinc carboxypeptidase [Algiphilus sp.]
MATAALSAARADTAEPLPLVSVERSCAHIEARLASVRPEHCALPALVSSGVASVEGWPLLYADLPPTVTTPDGRPPLRVLLFGGIHGDELSSVSVVFQYMAELDQRTDRTKFWRIIPALNPDGLLRRPATRTNANGVDLNRNFPSPDWQRAALPHWRRQTGSDPRRYPGPDALSEPESQWLAEQIIRFAPDVVVAMHAPLGLLDFDGRRHEAPERLGFLKLDQLGTYPGSLGRWAGEYLGIPVVTPELPHAGIMPTAQQAAEMWRDLEQWMVEHVVPGLPASPRLADSAPEQASPWLTQPPLPVQLRGVLPH